MLMASISLLILTFLLLLATTRTRTHILRFLLVVVSARNLAHQFHLVPRIHTTNTRSFIAPLSVTVSIVTRPTLDFDLVLEALAVSTSLARVLALRHHYARFLSRHTLSLQVLHRLSCTGDLHKTKGSTMRCLTMKSTVYNPSAGMSRMGGTLRIRSLCYQRLRTRYVTSIY